MFNPAIFFKTMRDSAGALLLGMIGLVAFGVVFVWIMLNMGTEILEFVGKFSVIKKLFEMSLGIDVSGEVSLNVLLAVCFTHGVVMMVTWSTLIATATRITAGEVERGTADMLLTLPVSRSEVYLSTSAVWFLMATVLAAGPLIGIAISLQLFTTEEEVSLVAFIAPALNFFCVNLAVGAIATMVGCIFNRRGPAIGVVAVVIFVSVVLNFIEPFTTSIKSVRFLGLLNYFRPSEIVRTGEWPVANMAILLAIAGVCWLVGLAFYSRKDIPTA